jgi:hypothetical protein
VYWPDIEGLAQRGVMTDESKQFYKDGCEDNVYAQRAYEGICSTSLSGYKIPTTDKRVLRDQAPSHP